MYLKKCLRNWNEWSTICIEFVKSYSDIVPISQFDNVKRKQIIAIIS